MEPRLFAFVERAEDAAFAVIREAEISSFNHATERPFGTFARGCTEPDLP